MLWKCDACGASYKVKTRRVFCECGVVGDAVPSRTHVSAQPNQDPLRAATWEIEERLRACRLCHYFSRTEVDLCTQIDMGCHNTFRRVIRQTGYRCPRDKWPDLSVKWYRTSELVSSAIALSRQFPDDIDGIVGVPRSGMIPAAAIATRLHLPLYVVSRGAIMPLPAGLRSQNLPPGGKRLILVDDSVGSGTQLTVLENEGLDLRHMLKAAVFVTPAAADAVDYSYEIVGAPHLFEWNFFNGPHVQLAALDMDGIICEDGPPSVYDGDQREGEFLRNVKPLCVPRNPAFKTPAIITARSEKYRDVTESWLRSHGAQYNELIMWSGPASERTLSAVAAWKVNCCRELDVSIYVESDPHIVREMRALSMRVLDIAEGCLR